MKRKIIAIEEAKCNGCGLCASACHEGAIVMMEGKARLLRDDYCDGLGDCLPVCPMGAITFVEREALAYDEAAVRAAMQEASAKRQAELEHAPQHACTCPGTKAKALQSRSKPVANGSAAAPQSELAQWPVQLKLVPVSAPYFNGCSLLIAADCTAFAHGDFHRQFMAGRVTLIGCPKLDEGNYADKLTEILRRNEIRDVTIVRMEVPCCAGLANAAIEALKNCGKMIPWQVAVLAP